jgi:hypothetical protein
VFQIGANALLQELKRKCSVTLQEILEEQFTIGDKVFLIHLQETGKVTGMNGADMVFVQLNDMEIPVYCSDITKKIPSTKEAEIKKPEAVIQRTEKKDPAHETIIKSGSGISLAFVPVMQKGGEIIRFEVMLLNDTPYAVSFGYWLGLYGETRFSLEKIVLPYQPLLLHELEYDALNEGPLLELKVTDLKNEQLEGRLAQKIRPQNFFNKLSKMPLTGKEAYGYKVKTIAPVKKQKVPSQEKPAKIAFDPDVLKQLMMDSAPGKDLQVSEAAREIDLHIEALTEHYKSMSNGEMIHLQLAEFSQMLDRAIANGLTTIHVIHGVGSGKLKKEIHRLLKSRKEVKSFNNDYHPRYAYGATEVILK